MARGQHGDAPVDGGHIAVDILVQARCMRVEEEESGSYSDGD